MVKVGDLIKLHESALAVVQAVETIQRTHDGADGQFLALKVIQQDNPSKICVYNVSLTEDGELFAADLIWGDTRYGTIESLTVEKPD
jgi:hypothetical protein